MNFKYKKCTTYAKSLKCSLGYVQEINKWKVWNNEQVYKYYHNQQNRNA